MFKKVLNFLKKNRWHILNIFILVVLGYLAWHRGLSQGMDNEGFVYFSMRRDWDWRNQPIRGLKLLLTYDFLAIEISQFLIYLFKDNIAGYQFFRLIIACLINPLFYYLVFEMTEKKVIALAAAIFFGINFISGFEYFGDVTYQFFVQRIPNLFFAFLAFILFIRFIKKKTGSKGYWLALLFWSLGLFLAEFNLFLLPLFIFYPLFLFWFNKKRNRKNLKRLFLSVLPFIISSALFYYRDRFFFYSRPHWWIDQKGGFFYFLLHPGPWLSDMAYQLTWMTLPRGLILLVTEPQYREPLIIMAGFLLPFYLIAAYYVYKYGEKLRAVFFASLFFIFATLFLNSYICSYQITQLYWASRYFYIPFMGFSVMLGIFGYLLFYKRSVLGRSLFFSLASLWAILTYLKKLPDHITKTPWLILISMIVVSFFSIFDKKKFVGKVLFLVIVVSWVWYNLYLIRLRIDEKQWLHNLIRETVQYVKENSPKFPDGALVILPRYLEPDGVTFCERFYGRGTIHFEGSYVDWQGMIKPDFNLNKLIVINYDLEKKKVIDQSTEFRDLIKKERKKR